MDFHIHMSSQHSVPSDKSYGQRYGNSDRDFLSRMFLKWSCFATCGWGSPYSDHNNPESASRSGRYAVQVDLGVRGTVAGACARSVCFGSFEPHGSVSGPRICEDCEDGHQGCDASRDDYEGAVGLLCGLLRRVNGHGVVRVRVGRELRCERYADFR